MGFSSAEEWRFSQICQQFGCQWKLFHFVFVEDEILKKRISGRSLYIH